MNYLMLAAIAFFFCLLGFSLHAIFFNKKERFQSLSWSNRALREDLRKKETEALDIRSEMIRLKKHIGMLENQIRRRNVELNDLYHGTLRRQERIALLERTVEKIYTVQPEMKETSGISTVLDPVSSSENFRNFADPIVPKEYYAPLKSNGEPPVGGEEPLWRKKLNTILAVLNEIEK
ncbi:MAG: hypothetical protein JXR49_15680 [Acidobacteria bacterium]|nr:hypothetical protein [Acidobacteriota bacterium]